eukprot:NODE_93_length_21581_cov_0.291919.p2 type:complete len:664 gc:universal NODE_93_length_21581_cov_0.291919:18532-16541(-)
MFLRRKHLFRSLYFDGEFIKAKELTIRNVESIHSLILKEEDPMRIVQLFDRLSDSFCNLLDGLECIRNIHPIEKQRYNASRVFEDIAPIMHSMNSDIRLLQKIEQSLHGNLSSNALMVAKALRKDFQKAGAHLPDSVRSKVEALNTQLQITCSKFIQAGYEEKKRSIPINNSDITGIEEYLKEYLEVDTNGNMSLTLTIHSGLVVLSYCHSEELRQIAHLMVTNAGPEQLLLFEEMIKIRYQISTLQGFKSYTELTAGDRYLKSTNEIMDFIRVYDRAQFKVILPILHEMNKVGKLKDWNTMYIMNQLNKSNVVPSPIKNQKSPYTIDSVIVAANFALQHLFGITLNRIDDSEDLLLHGSVTKYAVKHKRGLLGYIYFDLQNRQGEPKLAEAAHFTIRCPRRVDWDFIQLDSIWMHDSTSVGSFTNLKGEYQLPCVVLVTNFTEEQLTFHEASTVFHELGHAIHTMLGITDLQMLSGTRCLHDIAEVPSIFMEKMIVNPYVLHHVFKYDVNESREVLNIQDGAIPAFESALEIIEDIWMSVVDQALHSELIGNTSMKNYYTCGIVAGLNDKTVTGNFRGDFKFKKIEKEALNTKYASFPHLTGYGSCYYSYLFARAIANKMHIDSNTFNGAPSTWKHNGLAEQFMTMGGYHSKEFLDKLVQNK